MSRLFFSLALAALLCAPAAFAEPLASGKQETWWDRSKEGWFWYQDPPIEAELEAPQEPEAAAPKPTARDFSLEELWSLHPERFQEIYTNTLNAAVQHPSEPNVKDWYRMQDISRRKSVQFANVAAYVAQTNPEFNYIKDSPLAAPGRKALYQQQFGDIETAIHEGRQTHGLLFFYSRGCGYCAPQAEILQAFTNKYRWEIKGVDIDAEPGLAARFDIETTPTILLVNQEVSRPFPVAVGVISLAQIEQNIYRGMRLLGGGLEPSDYSLYEFQRGSALDAGQPMRRP